MQIVLARLEDDQELVKAGRADLGESPTFRPTKKAVAVRWLEDGTAADLAKAEAYAAEQGYSVFHYIGEADPLDAARRAVLAAAAVAETRFRWEPAPYMSAASAQIADVPGVGRLLVKRDAKGSRTFRVMVNGGAVAFKAPSLADGCRQAEDVARRILAARAVAAGGGAA